MKPKQDDYPYIRAWCQMMGSSNDFTQREVQTARDENAPADAIYRETGNRVGWSTFADVTRADTRMVIENIMEGYKS